MFLAAGLGLQLITPAGGAAGGAAAGAYLCWDSSAGVIAGIIASIKCAAAGAGIGALASAFGVPLGTGIGFVVDICLSLTMGSGLILALFLAGILDFKYVGAVFVGEALPGLDIIPGWTLLVIRCIMKKNAESAVGIAGVASKLASGALSPGSATGLARITAGLSAIKSDTRQMAQRSPGVKNMYDSNEAQMIKQERSTPVQTKNFDGINRPALPRAANDNLPSYVQKAA